MKQVSGHYWTIAPFLFAGVDPRQLQSIPWQTTVRDNMLGQVRLSGLLSDVPGANTVLIIVHGLGGQLDRSYMLRAAHVAKAHGMASLRLALRGYDRSGQDIAHGAIWQDVAAAIASSELLKYENVYVLGYSVGGHVCLHLGLNHTDQRVRAVAAVCPPLDFHLSQKAVDRPGAWLYRRSVLADLKQIYATVTAHREMPVPLSHVLKVRTLYEWDRLTVVPRFGFESVEDYYSKSSIAPRLSEVTLPSLIITSDRDPFLPAWTVNEALRSLGSNVEHLRTPRGGHVGFPPDLDLGLGATLGLESQIMHWFDNHRARTG